MKWLVICSALAVSACAAPNIVYRDRFHETKVAVPQPCVAGSRPAAVAPLKQAMTDDQWAATDVRQKAAMVGKQGLAHKSYSEDLEAATAGCL